MLSPPLLVVSTEVDELQMKTSRRPLSSVARILNFPCEPATTQNYNQIDKSSFYHVVIMYEIPKSNYFYD